MRTLFYVPVLHGGADLGSLRNRVSEKAKAVVGEKRWREHQRAIAGFWKALDHFILSKSFPTPAKVYQDGLAAGGKDGLEVARKAAAKGSKNFQLVAALAKKGAQLVKTEDLSLAREEVRLASNLAHATSLPAKIFAFLEYKLNASRLLKERDAFIARAINSTLEEGETGILFLGAYHDVLPRLNSDIKVRHVRERSEVKRYQEIFYLKTKEKEARALAKRLAAPIEVTQ